MSNNHETSRHISFALTFSPIDQERVFTTADFNYNIGDPVTRQNFTGLLEKHFNYLKVVFILSVDYMILSKQKLDGTLKKHLKTI